MLNCKKSCWMAALVGGGIVIGAMGMGVVTTQPEGDADMEAMMQAWMEMHQPNAHHKALESMAGDWTFVMEDMRTGEKYDGTQKDEMGLDGRFLLSHVQTSFGDMPFEGMGCMGYDNMAKKYVSVWIDSMSTNVMLHEGQASADGKTITLKGSIVMPDGSKMDSKHVYHLGDGQTMKLDFYEGPAGSDLQKTGMISYTRK